MACRSSRTHAEQDGVPIAVELHAEDLLGGPEVDPLTQSSWRERE